MRFFVLLGAALLLASCATTEFGPQLPGDLSSSPDRVCLLKLTDGLLDLGRRPPRTALWTGRTVPQVGQIAWPLLPGKRPSHPAGRSLQSLGDLHLPQALLA